MSGQDTNGNAVNDTCELIEAELDLVAGGEPTHYEFGASYGAQDLVKDIISARPLVYGNRVIW
jgi:hypothetical protein